MKYLDKSQIFILLMLIGLLLVSCDSTEQIDVESSATDSLVIELIGIDSVTPLMLLLETHEVEYRGSMMGSFVTAIDSVENSSEAFWVYSVNDTIPQVACNKMSLKPGDRLKWHFRLVGSGPDSDSSSGE